MAIKWSEKYRIGIDQIDEEHQEIFEEFEKLYVLMRVGAGHSFYNEVLEFLNDYIETHLKHEEDYQLSIDYPDYELHKASHDEFRNNVIQLKEDHRMKKITNADLITLNSFLQTWLVKHILVEDMKIAAFLENLKELDML